MIYFTCPSCQRIGQASDDLAGRQAACPACGQAILVPHFVLMGTPAAPPPPTKPTPPPDDDGMLRFFCPGCQKKLKVPQSALHTVINCKGCGLRVDVAAAVQRLPAPPPGHGAGPTSQSVLAYLPDLIPEQSSHYYFIKNNQQHGPVTALALRQMASSGQLLPTDLVWKPGFARWKPASKAKGLFPPPRPARTPPPPDLKPPPLPTQRPTAITEPAPAPELPPAPVHLQRGLALAEVDHDRALAELDAALRLEPHNAQALAARGLIHAKSKGNYPRGLADLSAAIRLAPGEPALYEVRAVLHREMGAVPLAQADERKAHELRAR